MVPLPVTIIDREPVSCIDMVGDDVKTTPAPFTAFERVYAQTAGSTDASLKAIAKQEFISVFNEQRRRLLVANGEFLAALCKLFRFQERCSVCHINARSVIPSFVSSIVRLIPSCWPVRNF